MEEVSFHQAAVSKGTSNKRFDRSAGIAIRMITANAALAPGQPGRWAALVELDAAIDNPLKLKHHFQKRRFINARCSAKS